MKKSILLILISIVMASCMDSKTDGSKIIKTESKEEMRLEVNMIVSDARAAADYYPKVLNAEIISSTNNELGMNETMMRLGGVEVRVLDENKDMGMIAPAQVGGQAVGINLFVDDIDAFFDNAIKHGCTSLSPVQEFPEIPAKNAVFSDKFNHLWVINQKY